MTNISWVSIRNIKDILLFRIHGAWIILIPILSNILEHLNVNLFQMPTCPRHMWIMLYIASLMLFVARIIYETRCPSLIKEFDSLEHFLSTRPAPISIQRQLLIFFPANDVNQDYNQRFNTSKSKYSPDNTDHKLGEYYHYAIDKIKTSRLISLAVCVLFYIIGVAIIILYIGGNINCQLLLAKPIFQ